MKEHRIDRLFDRFRRKGDTGALARVFDATAADLLALAVHLTGDLGTAEDLVQRTFLTAIEKKGVYDAGRRLMPWLVGILVRHAHAERRRRGRDGGGVAGEGERAGGLDPAQAADGQELLERLEAALAELPSKYREVLEPHLLHGERAVDIARSSGRSPGTVRVQIRRGLEQLRRTLPAGLALGAGFVLRGRGLADVRATVLRRTASESGSTGSLLSSTTLFGGLTMTLKAGFLAAALLLVALAGWAVRDGFLDRSSQGGDPHVVAVSRVSEESESGPELAQPSTLQFTHKSEARKASTRTAPGDSFVRSLAGATGRVIDEEGTPLPGLAVSLIELRGELLDVIDAEPVTPSRRILDAGFLVDEATTDEDGRFRLGSARPVAAHALVIDPGGAHAALHFVDQMLSPGETEDVGTIRIVARRDVRGRILDPEGRPVAGARVRAAPLPLAVLGLAELHPGARFLLPDSHGPGALIELPRRLAELLDHLPYPETRSAADGGFTLAGVPFEETRLVVDTPLLGLCTKPISAETLEVGDVAFSATHKVKGRVVDASGTPVEGAEIVAGTNHPIPQTQAGYAIARWSSTSDVDGGFTFRFVPQRAELLVAVRRESNRTWTMEHLGENGEIVLPVDRTLAVLLHDQEGRPVENASLEALSGRHSFGIEFLGACPRSQGVVYPEGDGRYRVERLAAGPLRIRASAEGFSWAEKVVDLGGSDAAVELALDRCAARQLEIVDRGTEGPVAGVRVVLVEGEMWGSTLASGVSDGRGLVVLDRVPLEGSHALRLRLSHPGYAGQDVEFDPSAERTRIELDGGGAAEFRLSSGGAVPPEPLLLIVQAAGGFASDSIVPLFGHTNAQGRTTFERLSTGEWYYSIYPRVLDRALLAQELSGHGKKELASGFFEVSAGERTTVSIDLPGAERPDSAPALAGALEGSAKVEGVDPADMRVGLAGVGRIEEPPTWQEVSSDGSFFFDGMDAGAYTLLLLEGESEFGAGGVEPRLLATSHVDLHEGRLTRIDLDLHVIGVRVVVRDEAGSEVRDATVTAVALSGTTKGAEVQARVEGRRGYRLELLGAGEYWLRAQSPTSGVGTAKAQVSEVGDQVLEVQLALGLPCAGRIVLPEAYGDTSGSLWISVLSVQPESSGTNVQLEFRDGEAEFEFQGLSAGPCVVRVYLAPSESALGANFSLPAGGDRNLVLHPVDTSQGTAIKAKIASGVVPHEPPVSEQGKD